MHVKVNGQYQATRMTLTLPRIGLWTAEITLDTTETVSGSVTISIADTMTFQGTVMKSGQDNSNTEVLVVGGAGGLSTVLPGKAYYQVPFRTPFGDILTSVGETMSPTSDSGVLSTRLVHWCRAAGTAQKELELMIDHIDKPWRVLPDGSVWVGDETWADSAEFEYVTLSRDPKNSVVILGAEVPKVYPGETLESESFEGGHVSNVEHVYDGRKIRTEVTF